MRRISLLLVLVLLVSIAGPVHGTPTAGPYHSQEAVECTFPMTTTDATGTDVRIDEEPRRVVSLNPSAAQTMWEIGGREKVVGLTKYAEYLEGASERELVSSESDIVVYERVVELRPDLVLAPSATDNQSVEKLREAGLTVYQFPQEETIEDVYGKTLLIGRLTGECEGAEATVGWMRDEIATVERAVDGEPRPDVLYAFFGYTAGEGTFIDELIELAGANNIAADAGVEGYQELSSETIVEKDPDWIVLNSRDPAIPDVPAFDRTTAVRRNQTIVIPIEHLNQPAPRVIHAVTDMTETFHPVSYAEEDSPDSNAEPTNASGDPSPPENDADSAPTDPPEQPGFGFGTVVAVVAITAIARFVRRG